jgi:hypothetical protein
MRQRKGEGYGQEIQLNFIVGDTANSAVESTQNLALQKLLAERYDEIGAQLRLVLATGTFSFCFQLDLALAEVSGRYNVMSIIDEVAKLEGTDRRPSGTKPASQFTGPHLSGLWHKHHFQARFVPNNLLNELRRSDVVDSVLAPHMGEQLNEKIVKRLVYAVVIDNLEIRGEQKRLTGEWIVFQKLDGANRYLTLASHKEGDAAIAQRISEAEQLEAALTANSGEERSSS